MSYRSGYRRRISSRQRKIGELLHDRTEPETLVRPFTRNWSRTVSGVFEREQITDAFRAVQEVCFPWRGFLRLEIGEFFLNQYIEPPAKYPLLLRDTNKHGSANGIETVASFKSGSSYSQPSLSLCREGHVPLAWIYKPNSSYTGVAHGILTENALRAGLVDLKNLTGAWPSSVRIVVEDVLLKPPGEESDRRTIMSWGAA